MIVMWMFEIERLMQGCQVFRFESCMTVHRSFVLWGGSFCFKIKTWTYLGKSFLLYIYCFLFLLLALYKRHLYVFSQISMTDFSEHWFVIVSFKWLFGFGVILVDWWNKSAVFCYGLWNIREVVFIRFIVPFIIVESTKKSLFYKGFHSHLQKGCVFFVMKGFWDGESRNWVCICDFMIEITFKPRSKIHKKGFL